ncbi:MAG: GNAT family N-acetyltransferase [Pseudomonadota bacterium]
MSVRLSFDAAELQRDGIHAFLTDSYWARGIARDLVDRAIDGSLCVGAYDEADQVGFARVVTDRATFAYLADVFVLPDHRGKGVARAMVQALHDHPELQGLRRWLLATADAHPVYAGLGWTPVAKPERFMERHFPNVYGAVS